MAEKPQFTRNDVARIREGVLAEEAGFKPLSGLGVDFSLRPSTIFGALPGVGGFVNIGQAIGKYQLEDSANKFFGVDKGFRDTSVSSGMNDSATNTLIKDIKAFKENNPYSTTNNITRDDIQDFMMSKKPDLDLAPIQNRAYTQNELNELNDRTGGFTQSYSTQPFSSGRTAQNITGTGYRSSISPSDRAAIEEDQAISGYSDFSSALGGGYYDNELKSVSDFASDNINQSNITNAVDQYGKSTYDPAFSRAVTKENQEASGSDTTSSTFICTALYEMKQMPISIYKYEDWYELYRRQFSGNWMPRGFDKQQWDKDLRHFDQTTLWWLVNKVEKYKDLKIGIFEDDIRWNYFTQYGYDNKQSKSGKPPILRHYSGCLKKDTLIV